MITYSKPSSDIASEFESIYQTNDALLEEQSLTAQALRHYPLRSHCMLCGTPVSKASKMTHRKVDYLHCLTCSHVQSVHEPANDYPESHRPNFLNFESIYQQPTLDAFLSRRARVYSPKLDWVLSEFNKHDIEPGADSKKWLEFGCGLGYFLHALMDKGFKRLHGLEISQQLVEQSSNFFKRSIITHYDGTFQAIDFAQYDVIASFFVFEHIPNPKELWEKLSTCKPGTALIFSVPMFSFSTLLESTFPTFAARNLDSVLHTQLYTDESIDYGLELSGFEMLSSWNFGQDASDLVRAILNQVHATFDKAQYRQVKHRLINMVDDLQSVIDRNHFCDARHIIAIKKG